MKRKEKIKYSADEYDAFTGWRKHLIWKRGQLKKIFRGYNKKVRRIWKNRCKEWQSNGDV